MQYGRATRIIQELKSGSNVFVDFVTPIVSVCLAAFHIASGKSHPEVVFSEGAKNYAFNCGLSHSLGVSEGELPQGGALVGHTYCQLSRLHTAHDVESCNGVIGSLLRAQLSDCPNKRLVTQTCGVVGELHDNIASHADGAGFSAAQLYKRENDSVIHIAFADCGCGLSGSLRKTGVTMGDSESILWCLKRGNTTARKVTTGTDLFGPQRLERDSSYDPYPRGTEKLNSDNNHMGEGLYRLTELIRVTGGKTWIWSGKAHILCTPDLNILVDTSLEWIGTAIEIEIPLTAFQSSNVANSKKSYEDLARRLGL